LQLTCAESAIPVGPESARRASGGLTHHPPFGPVSALFLPFPEIVRYSPGAVRIDVSSAPNASTRTYAGVSGEWR